MQRHVLAALIFERYVWFFNSLHPPFEMSCDTEYLEQRLLIFLETWSPSFCIVCNSFDDFRTNLPKNIGRFHRKQNTKFPKRCWVRSKNVFFWRCSAFFSGCNRRKLFWEIPQISLLGTIRVFCSNAESRFGRASFRTLRSVLWLFTSCVWDVLWYRILIKTALVSWVKQKLSKTTLNTFQNCLSELWWACCFGCN